MNEYECWIHYDRSTILHFRADDHLKAAIDAASPLRRGNSCKIWAAEKPNPTTEQIAIAGEDSTFAWPTYFVEVRRSFWTSKYTAKEIGPERM
jgi:hypothetical protein